MKSELKRWLHTHFFRIWTMIATWIGLVAAYYYRPELLTWWLRTTTAAIEKVCDAIHYPWGDRIEIFLRFVGGSFWLQIALAIVIIRIVAWLLGHGCRHGWRLVRSATTRRRGDSYELHSYTSAHRRK